MQTQNKTEFSPVRGNTAPLLTGPFLISEDMLFIERLWRWTPVVHLHAPVGEQEQETNLGIRINFAKHAFIVQRDLFLQPLTLMTCTQKCIYDGSYTYKPFYSYSHVLNIAEVSVPIVPQLSLLVKKTQKNKANGYKHLKLSLHLLHFPQIGYIVSHIIILILVMVLSLHNVCGLS